MTEQSERNFIRACLAALTTAIALIFVLVWVARAEDKKPDPKPLTDTASVAVLKADSALKDAQLEIGRVNTEWQLLMQQPQIRDLQERGTKAQAKLTEAQKADEAAVAAAAKAIGLDPAKYELDHSKLVFSPKAEPAKPTPSPEKK